MENQNDLKDIKAQLKAFKNYIEQFIKDSEADKNADSFNFNDTEVVRIFKRYERLRTALNASRNDIFTDLTYFRVSKYETLNEVSREVSYVLDTLEHMEQANTADNNRQETSADGDLPQNNTPFTERETKLIAQQLDIIENHLIKIVNEQEKTDQEKVDQIQNLKEEFEEFKQSSTKIGRKDWTLQFFGAMTSILLNLTTSAEARMTLFFAIQMLLNYIQGMKLLSS